MPFLDLETSGSDAIFELGIDWESFDMAPMFGLVSTLALGLDLVATLSNDMVFEVDDFELGIDINGSTFLRISTTEANVFLEAELDLGIEMPDVAPAGVVDMLCIFDFGIDLESFNATLPERELDDLILTVNIYPVLTVPANYQEYKVRFKIDDTEIPINSFTVKAAPNKIGVDVSVGLSRLSDKSLVTAAATYELDLGVVIDDVPQWFPIAIGQLAQDSYTIGWEKNSPTDTVNLSHSENLSNKINISPLRTTVMYDSNDLTLSPDDFTPIYDAGGGVYPVILMPIPGLNLYTVLSIVFSACGLSFSTNLPNYRVKRLDIEIGQSYFQAISGLFGAFEPIIVERDGTVYILDSTQLSIPGFSPGKTITPSNYKSVAIDHSVQNINGYIVKYTETADAWDDYSDDEDTSTHEIIDIDEATTTIIETTTFTRNYKRMSVPGVVVRSEVRKIVTTTSIIDPVVYDTGDPVVVDRVTETFTYDSTGKVLKHRKTQFSRVPIWYPSVNPLSAAGDGFWQYDFRQIREDLDVSVYKSNPFKHGTEYRETFSQTAQAFVYIDPDKLYETKDEAGVLDIDPDKEVPVDYKQQYIDAYRSGNLSEDGDTEFSTILSRLEKVTPLNKDFSRVETKEVDFITKVVTVDVAEEQIGEISTSSQTSIQKQFIVLAPGGGRTNGRLEVLNIGEIPMAYGVALAQRKIIKNLQKDKNMSLELIGYDPAIDRGIVTNILGRGSEDLGNYLIEGYTISGKSLGTTKQTIMTTAEARLT